MSTNDLSQVFSRSIIPFRFVFLTWLFFVVEFLYGYKFHHLGILPRNPFGLIGVATAPLLHTNLTHLISNTVPLLVLGATMFYFYYRYAKVVFLAVYFIPNLLVWIFARPVMHIGASGIIYGMATFLIVFGVLRRDFKSLLISGVVLVGYSGLFMGLLVKLRYVSYEMHFAGVAVGLAMAIYSYLRTKKP